MANIKALTSKIILLNYHSLLRAYSNYLDISAVKQKTRYQWLSVSKLLEENVVITF